MISLFKPKQLQSTDLKSDAAEFIKIVGSSTSRKDKASKWLALYEDEHQDYVQQLIASTWANPEKFRPIVLNLIKKIINKRANLYRMPPKRTFFNVDDVQMNQIYTAANVDIVLKRLSRLTKLLKTTAVQIAFVDGELELFPLTGAILDVEYTNPLKPTRIIITHLAEKPENVTYSDWTATTYTRRDHRGNILPNNTNPYGLIPIIPLFDHLPSSEFFLRGGADLISLQEAVSIQLSNLDRTAALQSFGVPWATGLQPDAALKASPDSAILLPDGGSFQFASPNAPIDSLLNTLEFLLKHAAISNDLSANVFDLDQRSESGRAMEISNQALAESRADDLALWRQYEQRIFKVISTVLNTHGVYSVPDNAQLGVDFQEAKDVAIESERLANAAKKLEMGVWSPVDIELQENPDAYDTRKEAEAELLRRKDESESILIQTN